MHAELADFEGDANARVRLGEQLFNCVQVFFGKGSDRGASSAQAYAEEVGMLERECFLESRHQRLAVWLMHAILERFPQQRKLAALQGLQQQGNALEIEDGVGARQPFGQNAASRRSRQRQLRRQDNTAQRFRPVQAGRKGGAVGELATGGKSAEQSRGYIIGMTLQVAGRVEQSLRWQRAEDGLIETESGDGGGGAAAQAAFHRDVADDLDRQGRERTSMLHGQEAEGAFDVVFAIELLIEKLELEVVLASGRPH